MDCPHEINLKIQRVSNAANKTDLSEKIKVPSRFSGLFKTMRTRKNNHIWDQLSVAHPPFKKEQEWYRTNFKEIVKLKKLSEHCTFFEQCLRRLLQLTSKHQRDKKKWSLKISEDSKEQCELNWTEITYAKLGTTSRSITDTNNNSKNKNHMAYHEILWNRRWPNKAYWRNKWTKQLFIVR